MDKPVVEAPPTRSLTADGPPLWIVVTVFAGLVAISWGRSNQIAGLAVLAVGVLVAVGAGVKFGFPQSPRDPDAPPPLSGTPRPPQPERPLRIP